MGRLRRSRVHKGIKDVKKSYRTRRRTKDLDQVEEDIAKHRDALEHPAELDADLPGMGQFYCVECARHFIQEPALVEHKRGKVHKRRLKELKQGAYTQKEAEAAVGLTTEHQRAATASSSSAMDGR